MMMHMQASDIDKHTEKDRHIFSCPHLSISATRLPPMAPSLHPDTRAVTDTTNVDICNGAADADPEHSRREGPRHAGIRHL